MLILSIFTLSACASDLSQNSDLNTEDSETIKIGFIGPLTGNAAAYGQDVKSGVELYFKENPTIDGKSVEVIYEDGKCNGQDAANAAQKLVNVDKVQVILGGQCSGESLAAVPIATQAKVLMLSSLSSSPDLSSSGKYFFRNYPSDDKVSETLVDELIKNDYKAVAVIAEQTDYSQGFSNAVKAHMESKEVTDKLVLQESYAVDNTDFRTLLTKVKEEGADVLVSIAQTPVTNGFAVKQARELGLDIVIYGTDTIDGKDFFDTAKDAANGVRQVVVAEDPSRSGYSALVERSPEAQSSHLFIAFGYDSAGLVADAINVKGYDATLISEYFDSMEVYKGVATDVDFDENGDNLAPASIKTAKDGKFYLSSDEAMMEKKDGEAMMKKEESQQ